MDLYEVQSTTKKIVTIDKGGVALHVRPDQVTAMARLPSSTEPTAAQRNTEAQSKHGTERVEEENSLHPADLNDPEPAKYATDQVALHRRTESRTEYKIQWYGYGAKDDIYEAASALPSSFFWRYWSARRRYKVPRSEKTGERITLRQG